MTKAISIYSWQNTKLQRNVAISLSIFAVLTARTLYTYKYEVANNNDKVHRSALAFLSLESPWNDTFCRVGRAPVRVAPVRCSLGEAHLSGRPTGTLPMSGVPGLWRRRTPGCVGGAPAAGSAEHGGSFSSDSNSCLSILLPVSWLVRMIFIHFNLDYLIKNNTSI